MKKYLQSLLTCVVIVTGVRLSAQCTTFPVVNLGPDTTLCDTSFILDAGNAGMTFAWNTGATTQNLNAGTSGIFSVTVTDSIGCATSDTIAVTLNAPSVGGTIYLSGGDTILCGNEYALFYIGPHDGYVLWWAIDTTNQAWAPFGSGDTLDYGMAPNNITGVYTFVATITNMGCPPDTSNVLNISFYTSPEVDLGVDDTVCGLNLILYSGYPGEQNLWNNGDTLDYTVASSSGTYICTVTFQSGCWDADTVQLDVFPYPAVQYTCPIDTMCIGDGPLLLIPGTPAGGNFIGINVSNGYFVPPSAGGQSLIVYTWTDTVSGCVGGAGDYIWVDTCVGMQEIFANTSMKIYPDPATGKITIPLVSADSKVNIYDASGRLVLVAANNFNNTALEVDVTGLEDGMYFVRDETSDGVSWSSFLKHSE